MAKKNDEQPTDYLDIIEKQICKDFGEEVLVNAEAILKEDIKIISWGPAFDLMLSGGIPEGSTVSFAGKPKSGKSTSVLSFCANAQQLGKRIYWFDIEGRLKVKNLNGIKDLDLSPAKFKVIRSTENKILSSQDFLTIAELVLKTHPGSIVVLDSISALADDKELIGGVGTETRGHGAKVLSQFVNNTSNVVRVMKQCLIGMVHIIANTSGFGSPTMEKACNRWLYQSDVRLKVKNCTPWLAGKQEIGKKMNIMALESALGPPGLAVDTYLRYGTGLDFLMDVMQFAISLGLIAPNGAWYKMNFLEGKDELLKDTEYEDKPKIQCQGEENVYKALIKYPKWQETLTKEIKELSSSLVSYSSE